MMKKSFLLFIVLFFSCMIRDIHAQDSIAWMEAVAPPFFIHEGPLKRQGYEDLLTDILTANLPQYTHRRMQATISRHYQQWRQGEQACSIAMYRTPERMEFAYFSVPSCFTLPPGIIILKDNFKKFGGTNTIQLTKILQEGHLIIGRSTNRSYGVEMDNVLNNYGNANNIFSYEGSELTLNLFKMLEAKRIDGLAGLPEEAMYLAESNHIRDKIIVLSIAENMVNYDAMITRVACSKTEWGKKTIDTINQALIKIRPLDQYRSAYERWLDPNSITEYRRLYHDVFLKTTE